MKIYEFNEGRGKLLVNLAYANGFLPQTYRRALQPLFDHYRVVSIHVRAMWENCPPESLKNWPQMGDDLLAGLDGLTDDRPVIGIGHSMGGVATLYAALKRPERFSHLILIDPTLMSPGVLWRMRLTRLLGMEARLPLVQGALRRRQQWDSTEDAYQYFRSKPLFARWPDDVLRDYAQSMTVPADNGGVRLAFDPRWEAQFYRTVPTDVWKLPGRVQQPMLVIRGELTTTFGEASAANFRRLNPRAHIVTVKGAGHLVPQEKPDETGKLIADFLGIPA